MRERRERSRRETTKRGREIKEGEGICNIKSIFFLTRPDFAVSDPCRDPTKLGPLCGHGPNRVVSGTCPCSKRAQHGHVMVWAVFEL